MAKYTKDWATEAITHQYMKNKHSYTVQQGFLEVDEKYKYLKDNAAKWSNAPQGNGAGKQKVGSHISSKAPKKAWLVRANGKGKEKAWVEGDDEDENEDHEDESSDGGKRGGEEDKDIKDWLCGHGDSMVSFLTLANNHWHWCQLLAQNSLSFTLRAVTL